MNTSKPEWLIVCDASRARVIRVDSLDDDWRELEHLASEEGRGRSGSLVSDRPGRANRPKGLGRQAPVDAVDPSDSASRRFAAKLGRRLERAFDAHEFDGLFLVAPPRFLGQLRDALSPPVGRRVRGSMDKDLIGLSVAELRRRIPARQEKLS